MNVKVEKITPEMAESYLGRNMVNRHLNKDRVAQYALDMATGKWELNGEAIRFNKDGRLIDGQHRLSAIVKSGTSIRMVVMRDIENSVTIYDRGRNRSITDQFQIAGMDTALGNNSNVAICRLHYIVQAGVSQVPDSLVKEFLLNYEQSLLIVRDICKKAGSTKSGRVKIQNAPIGLALLYAIESGYSLELAKNWAQVVKDGFMESPRDSAAIVFRNDILSGVIDANTSTASKKRALYQTEKSLFEYEKGAGRKMSYSSWNEPIYSNGEAFKKDGKKALIWREQKEEGGEA